MDLICAYRSSNSELASLDELRRKKHRNLIGSFYFREYLSQCALKIEDECQIVSAQEIFDQGLGCLQPEFTEWTVTDKPIWANEVTRLREAFYDIYEKVVRWFDVMEKPLQDPAVLQDNVYTMDETGIMLSKLNSVKVIVGKENKNRGYRGARVKRTTVTAIECVSATGRYLNPMIIWPASTHGANWIIEPTPGGHYAYSNSRYTDSYLSLQWLKLVFDPQTKGLANNKPRLLICDGFGTHETLEILEFCFENNIILCRIPSHTSHKLQPCDVSMFGPLKSAYRDGLERLERGCVGTIGKEHFTYLYNPARKQAFTPRNIRAGWAKAGLFPFNPDKVLSDIPEPQAELTAKANEVRLAGPQDQVLPTPTTPVSVAAVAALHNLIKQDTHGLDETSRNRLQKHVQKLTNATQLSFSKRVILQEHNRFLTEINNEAKPRRAAKSDILGTARVMSYEDLVMAREERAKKEAAKEAKKAEKKAKKAAKGTNKAAGKGKRGRKRKSAGDEQEPKAKRARASDTQEAGSSQPDAPVPRMSERQVVYNIIASADAQAPVAIMSER